MTARNSDSKNVFGCVSPPPPPPPQFCLAVPRKYAERVRGGGNQRGEDGGDGRGRPPLGPQGARRR